MSAKHEARVEETTTPGHNLGIATAVVSICQEPIERSTEVESFGFFGDSVVSCDLFLETVSWRMLW